MQGVAWHLTALKSSSKVWNVKKAIIQCFAIFISACLVDPEKVEEAAPKLGESRNYFF